MEKAPSLVSGSRRQWRMRLSRRSSRAASFMAFLIRSVFWLAILRERERQREGGGDRPVDDAYDVEVEGGVGDGKGLEEGLQQAREAAADVGGLEGRDLRVLVEVLDHLAHREEVKRLEVGHLLESKVLHLVPEDSAHDQPPYHLLHRRLLHPHHLLDPPVLRQHVRDRRDPESVQEPPAPVDAPVREDGADAVGVLEDCQNHLQHAQDDVRVGAAAENLQHDLHALRVDDQRRLDLEAVGSLKRLARLPVLEQQRQQFQRPVPTRLLLRVEDAQNVIDTRAASDGIGRQVSLLHQLDQQLHYLDSHLHCGVVAVCEEGERLPELLGPPQKSGVTEEIEENRDGGGVADGQHLVHDLQAQLGMSHPSLAGDRRAGHELVVEEEQDAPPQLLRAQRHEVHDHRHAFAHVEARSSAERRHLDERVERVEGDLDVALEDVQEDAVPVEDGKLSSGSLPCPQQLRQNVQHRLLVAPLHRVKELDDMPDASDLRQALLEALGAVSLEEAAQLGRSLFLVSLLGPGREGVELLRGLAGGETALRVERLGEAVEEVLRDVAPGGGGAEGLEVHDGGRQQARLGLDAVLRVDDRHELQVRVHRLKSRALSLQRTQRVHL
eukprot:754234-Hanusia_phi.AAC.2